MPSWLMCTKEWVALLKDAATLLAALSALLYFSYKLVAGWLLLNLTVDMKTERISVEGEDDHLVVTVSLQKGKVDAMRLIAAELQLTPIDALGASPQQRPLGAIKRLKFPLGGRVQWDEEDEANLLLTLSTEETMTLAEHFRVKPIVIYRVDIVIQGDRFRDRVVPSLAQWRSSHIVLPAKQQSAA
jgi:hypothetical protein